MNRMNLRRVGANLLLLCLALSLFLGTGCGNSPTPTMPLLARFTVGVDGVTSAVADPRKIDKLIKLIKRGRYKRPRPPIEIPLPPIPIPWLPDMQPEERDVTRIVLRYQLPDQSFDDVLDLSVTGNLEFKITGGGSEFKVEENKVTLTIPKGQADVRIAQAPDDAARYTITYVPELPPLSPDEQVQLAGASGGTSDSEQMEIQKTLWAFLENIENKRYETAFDLQFGVPHQGPARQEKLAAFIKAYSSTTYEEDIKIANFRYVGADIIVDVAFTSHQSISNAPPGGGTCTRWDLTYRMKRTSNGWLIDSIMARDGQMYSSC